MLSHVLLWDGIFSSDFAPLLHENLKNTLNEHYNVF